MSQYQFRQTRRVQFAETDLAGIVHFSNFFRYMEEAEQLGRDLALDLIASGAERLIAEARA